MDYLKLFIMFILGIVIGYVIKTIERRKKKIELQQWLKGEKYILEEVETNMTEAYEKDHGWELSNNYIIDKTIRKIDELDI